MDSITQFLSSILSPTNDTLTFGQSLLAILMAYVGGLLSSLTPCVYPMIPITVGVVGGLTTKTTGPHSKQRMWHEVLIRGLVYISGMAVIYAFLGVVAGLTGRVFGSMTNTSEWYLALGVVISIAALIMMDVIRIDPSTWIDNIKRKIDHLRGKPHHTHHHTTQAHAHHEMSIIGAFALGASSGFIAAPCTTPILTSILAYITKTQSVGLGLALMLAFSFGLGTILLLIAAFTGALQILPRSGNWLNRIKIFSGIILLAFGEYLIYRAGTLGPTIGGGP